MGRVGFRLFFSLLLTLTAVFSQPVRAASDDEPRQGWSAEDRTWFYSVSQGSQLLPWTWMQVLEQPGNTDKFLAPTHMSALGYLPNPYGTNELLPIGFVVDQPEPSTVFRKICRFLGFSCGMGGEQAWLGLNCSACHTGQFSYGGKTIRVDGAPTLADFQTFTARILQALKQTREDPAKWQRFTTALGLADDDLDALEKLGGEVDAQVAWYDKLEKQNDSPLRYGPGRLDAQGHILNKVSLRVGVVDQLDTFPSDAPASYPFIWNVPQQDIIQWNGIVNNGPRVVVRGQPTDLGALGRNVGEVLGVFGQIDMSSSGKAGYKSSVSVYNLIDIERRIGALQSPVWPQEFGPINEDLRAKGQQLFARAGPGGTSCLTCHSAPLRFDDLTTKIKVQMNPIAQQQTDIWLACNTFLHQSKSGLLTGRKTNVFAGELIKPQDTAVNLLENAVIGTIIGRGDEVVERIFGDVFQPRSLEIPRPLDYLPGITDPIKKDRAQQCLTTNNKFLAYKARPLNGIWATAPYLHNGSVPTLYDLLLPSRMRQVALPGAPPPAIAGPVRPDSFKLGTYEYDPKKAGYVSDGGFEFRTHDTAGVPVLGNYNSGHDYGNANLTDDERWALVEYLKSL
jgi:cytochrome c peroxidase